MLSDNTFDEDSLELPTREDLQRAVAAVLLWRRQDPGGVATLLRQASREHRLGMLVAGLLFLCNQQVDGLAAIHGNVDPEKALEQLAAAIAASEDD